MSNTPFAFTLQCADDDSAIAHACRIDGSILSVAKAAIGTESVQAVRHAVIIRTATIERLQQIIAELVEEGYCDV